MDEKIITIVARAITFANLSDPNPEPGLTRLQAAISDFDARHLAVAALKALETAEYKIIKKGA